MVLEKGQQDFLKYIASVLDAHVQGAQWDQFDLLEYTPWNSEQNSSSHIHIHSLSEELQEDEATHEEEAAEHDLAVAKLVGQISIEDQTDNLSSIDTIGYASLDRGRNLICASCGQRSELRFGLA